MWIKETIVEVRVFIFDLEYPKALTNAMIGFVDSGFTIFLWNPGLFAGKVYC